MALVSHPSAYTTRNILLLLLCWFTTVYGKYNPLSVANVFLGTRQLVPVVVYNAIPNNNTYEHHKVVEGMWKEKWGFVMENNSLTGTIQLMERGNGTQKLFTTKLQLETPTSGQLYWAELQFTKSGKTHRAAWQKKMDFNLQQSQDGCVVSTGTWKDSWCEGEYFMSVSEKGMWIIRVDDATHNRTVFWYGTKVEREDWSRRVNKWLPPMIIIIAIVITRMFRIYLIPKAKVHKKSN